MNTKNLIFDIDGTLWNATTQITKAYNEIIKDENSTYPLITCEQMEGIMGMVIEDIAEIFFPYLPTAERMSLIHRCCDNENEYLKKHGGFLYQDVIPVLEQLLNKGYQMFIVSNCQVGYVDALCTAHPLKKYFLDHECSGNTKKPKGDNIRLLMERNHLENAVYIGDTQKDKDACEKAKIPFIYASYGFGKVDGYDEKIETFSDLLKIF